MPRPPPLQSAQVTLTHSLTHSLLPYPYFLYPFRLRYPNGRRAVSTPPPTNDFVRVFELWNAAQFLRLRWRDATLLPPAASRIRIVISCPRRSLHPCAVPPPRQSQSPFHRRRHHHCAAKKRTVWGDSSCVVTSCGSFWPLLSREKLCPGRFSLKQHIENSAEPNGMSALSALDCSQPRP